MALSFIMTICPHHYSTTKQTLKGLNDDFSAINRSFSSVYIAEYEMSISYNVKEANNTVNAWL